MKFKRRLIIYYLAATLLSMFFVGAAVLRGIEQLSLETMERQLIDQSKLAEIYISQIAYLDNSSAEGLSAETARRIITNLSLVLGNVRIYDKDLNLLAATEASAKSYITAEENAKILNNALEGNYAYIMRGSTAYFASSLDIGNETFGVLQIIYPFSFLAALLRGVTGILLVGAAAFAVLMGLLSIYIAGRITKPINQLVSATEHYARREFMPVEVESSDEIAQLCRSFNAMGVQLKEYIQRQRLFVSNVSHELRTPLTAIKGYSEYLSDEVKGQPDLEKAVYHLNNESARLEKLVDEVLTLSRIDSGREDFTFETINISTLIEEAIDKMSLRAEKYSILIKKELRPNIYIRGDREKLMQVLVNLLDNAIKFSPAQSFVRLQLNKEGSLASLSITDQGMGIHEDEPDKLFERFYRGENAKGISGTGLGLSIVKYIVDAHKGTIEFEAGVSKGTTANIRLPIDIL